MGDNVLRRNQYIFTENIHDFSVKPACLPALRPPPATATESRRRHPLSSLTNATMNGEFGRDENHCDDMEEEEEVILTHAEHKAQGNELYKSKGMFVLQIVRWPDSAVAC